MIAVEKRFSIVGVGEVMWDFYERDKFLGGTPANVVWHAQQIGDTGILVSRVGDDALGDELVTVLRQRGLTTAFIQRDRRKSTGRVHIALDAEGVPHYRGYQDVAFDYLKYKAELEELAPRADAVMYGTLAQRAAPTRRTLFKFLRAAARALKVFDLGYAHADLAELARILPESLEMADIVKMNVAEMKAMQSVLRREQDLAPVFMSFLIKQYDLKLVAVTLGAQGCKLFSAAETCALPALPIRALDTTGAGDAFTAGLMHQFLRGAPLREIAGFANLMGAFVCTQKGATPYFDLHALLEFRRNLPKT